MTSRAQDDFIERVALEHGRVAVRDGFLDGHVDVTAPTGRCWSVDEAGVPTLNRVGNFSINWRS